jgi:uncharacterized phage protein (TIGR02218 family)
MRVPSWEVSAGALATLLNTRTDIVVFDLYTITLAGGTVLRYSGTDVPVTVNGMTWQLGPTFERGRTRLTIGVQVDTLDVTLIADNSQTLAGAPILQYAARGGFDNAQLRIERAFKGQGDADVVGMIEWFRGRFGDVLPNRSMARLVVKSSTELLDVMVPREVYQPGCANTVYDGACGVDRASKTVNGSTASSTDATRTIVTINPTGAVNTPTVANGYFDLGVISWITGANAGQSRTVKRHQGQVTAGVLPAQVITMLSPLLYPAAPGDTFAIYPGCNGSKTDAGGCPKFYSQALIELRFRGHPYVPVPETVV